MSCQPCQIFEQLYRVSCHNVGMNPERLSEGLHSRWQYLHTGAVPIRNTLGEVTSCLHSYWVRVFIQSFISWLWTKPSVRGSCFSTYLIILRQFWTTYDLMYMSVPDEVPRTSIPSTVNISGVKSCTMSWRSGSFCRKNWARSYRCRAVVPLARIIVLPRLKSRFPSDLNTGFNSEMSLLEFRNSWLDLLGLVWRLETLFLFFLWSILKEIWSKSWKPNKRDGRKHLEDAQGCYYGDPRGYLVCFCWVWLAVSHV